MAPRASVSPVLLVVLLLAATATAQIPTGCFYNSGLYECDYRFALPLDFDDFNPQPQRLTIYNIDGAIDSSSFVDFDKANSTTFDSNYDAEFTLTCLAGGGEMALDSTSFLNMGFYKSYQINNCVFQTLPTRAFKNFGNPNYFGISGGSIGTVSSNALGGFFVRIDATSVDPKGELSLTNLELPGRVFPTGFLSTQVSLTKLTVDGSDLDTVPSDFLSLMPNLTTLVLDNNPFTALPSGLFTGVSGLTSLSFANVQWECSCADLWWLTEVADNGMIINSEVICQSPTSYVGTRAQSYYTSVCDTGLNCEGGSLPAINLGGVTCLTYLQLFVYILALIAFVGVSMATACWVHTRRQINRMDEGGPAARKGGNRVANRGRAPPPGIRGGWA